MGGNMRMMNKKGWQAIGLTPDKNQVKHIRATYPNTVLESKFEDMDASQYTNHFGTVFTSESLQYLNLEAALPLIDKILLQGGQWIACDYFKKGKAFENSGHDFNYFLKQIDQHGFKITYQEDITPHILPTIAFVHLWATQVVMPLKDFGIEKMEVKAPGIYYALKNAIPIINQKIQKNIDVIDPQIFAEQKQYILMMLERK
jgi:hypothetical protein